ncbi:ribose 5-phosphate isomerase B [Bacillus taeanensis]|uniref:Ribose 5-phosphate isomerase B n=1 Tax=Bacillus taeanensis TaxID=273032 RepID=A0A366XRQ5_9BACI|nr:ribose 5-phosphate isomerase B [Bacillus taeanensis]RBW68376.1 ribose 5-phosphate isomerase B [Bacillus taeanensis]
MKIGLGCDHNAYEFKEEIKKYLEEKEGFEVVDYGCHNCSVAVDYPDVSFEVAQDVRNGKLDRGILICGTGLGVAIAANKIPGVRAATAHDVFSAERAQLSNNAQIITMGAQVIGIELGKKIVEAYVNAHFTEGRSSHKVQKIIDKESELSNQLS